MSTTYSISDLARELDITTGPFASMKNKVS